MATGDLKNNMRKLLTQLRQMKYPGQLEQGITDGVFSSVLPIWHYAFLEYSKPLAELISSSGLSLYGKSDFRFVETIFKILRDLFSYKPSLTKDQIMSSGFAERKIIITNDILNLVKQKNREMSRGSFAKHKNTPRLRASKPSQPASQPEQDADQSVTSVTVTRAESSHLRIPVPIKRTQVVTKKPNGDPKPLDDGYRSSNASPEPDAGLAIQAFESRLMQMEETMGMVLDRLNRLEGGVANLMRDNETQRESREPPQAPGPISDHSLQTILGRLTLVESRLHLLQSQSPRTCDTLPAAKIAPRARSHSSQSALTQGIPVEIVTVAATSSDQDITTKYATTTVSANESEEISSTTQGVIDHTKVQSIVSSVTIGSDTQSEGPPAVVAVDASSVNSDIDSSPRTDTVASSTVPTQSASPVPDPTVKDADDDNSADNHDDESDDKDSGEGDDDDDNYDEENQDNPAPDNEDVNMNDEGVDMDAKNGDMPPKGDDMVTTSVDMASKDDDMKAKCGDNDSKDGDIDSASGDVETNGAAAMGTSQNGNQCSNPDIDLRKERMTKMIQQTEALLGMDSSLTQADNVE